MWVAAIPFACLILAYLPGYAVAGWYRARLGAPLAPPHLRPFAEILFSVCLSSWMGLLLAELAFFSLQRVLLLEIFLSVVLIADSRRREREQTRPGTGAGRGHDPRRYDALLAGVATGVLVGALYWPPFETIIMGSDASFYFNTGVHLARHGSISVPDPLLAELSAEDRALLFPRNLTGGYARVPGGLLLPSLDTEVVRPTFSHVLPVWIAMFHELGGLGACGVVATVFAALSLWAIFLFAAEILGRWAGVGTIALAITSFGEFWFGRFLMPEILAQFFLWAGLLNFVLWWRGSLPAAALSAFSLGIVGLTRVEYLFFVLFAVVLTLGLATARPRGMGRFSALYGTLLAHGVAHLILVPTHYRDVLQSQGRMVWAGLVGLEPLAIAVALLLAAALFALAARVLAGTLSVGVRRVAVLSGAGVYGAAFVYVSDFKVATAFTWLATTVPWPVLAVGALGLLRWAWQSTRVDGSLSFPLVLFLVVGAPFLYDPHVTPIQLWAVRRFLPVIIPFTYVFAVTALVWVARRIVWRRAGAIVSVVAAAALLVFNARPTAAIYDIEFFPDVKQGIRSLAETMSPGDVVFFPPPFTDVLIPLPLWLVHDRESFLLPHGAARRALRAAVAALSPRHTIFYVEYDFGHLPVVDGLAFQPRDRAELRCLLPELHPTRAPTKGRPLLMRLRVYEVAEATLSEEGASTP